MIRLGIDNEEYPIKSRWNELSKEDLLEICRIHLLEIDENYKRLMILKYFLGVNYQELEKLDPMALPEILDTLNYLFKESRLTINHFQEVEGMKGPETALTNFTFEQYFGQSEAYYSICLKDGKADDLISVMYNYKGDDKNNEKIKALPENIKLAIFLFYQGSSAFIKLKFKSVFQISDGKKPDGLEFTRLINSLNNNDISRNEQIKSTNLYEALTHLQTIIDGSK